MYTLLCITLHIISPLHQNNNNHLSDKYCERVLHTEEVRDPETDVLLHYDFKVINKCFIHPLKGSRLTCKYKVQSFFKGKWPQSNTFIRFSPLTIR